METDQKGADNSDSGMFSASSSMDASEVHSPLVQGDLPNCHTFMDPNISLSYVFPTIPVSFSTTLPCLGADGLKVSYIKEEKDHNQENQVFAQDLIASLNKMADSHFHHTLDVGKTDIKTGIDRSDLSIATQLNEEKGMSPLNISVVSYPDSSGGQQSPAMSSQTGATSLPFPATDITSDAMLSAINYNDSEMLHDGTFDMNSANSAGNLHHLDDGLLSNMGNPTQNIRLSEGQGAHTFDLFDSHVHDPLSLSPQPFSDAGFSVGDSTSLSAATTESSGYPRPAVESPTESGPKSKSKSKSSKSHLSPSKTNIQCPTCGKGFNNSSALAKHRLTHSEERKYICNVCSKGFKRQDHLNGHLMTHREKKPYQCQVENCEKSYCDARSLRRHLEANHQQSPEEITNSVLASMTAAGIATTIHNGKPRALDKLFIQQEAARMQQMASPTFCTNTTPSQSPGCTNQVSLQSNFFQFEGQSTSHQSATSQQQPPPATQASPQQAEQPQSQLPQQQDQAWQERVRVYDFPGSGHPSPSPLSGEQSPGAVQQVSPISPPTSSPLHSPQPRHNPWSISNPPTAPVAAQETAKGGDETKPPVQCSICHRRFKNIPALNGHMRLHGGYLKKSKEEKKNKKSDMGPPPAPPRSTQTISQMSNMLPTLSQAFPQPHPTTQEAVMSQAGIAQHSPSQIPLTIEQVGASQDGQALTPEQQQQIIQQHLHLHTLQLQEAEQRTNHSLEQIKQSLQAHEQQQQQLQQQQLSQQQISQGEQLSSAQPQTATEHIQQLAASVHHELLPQINLQQLEQIQQQAQQQAQQQIQLQPAVQVYQLPQLSPQQLEQLKQQHLQLGLPAQIPPSQLHQLVQDQHIQQLQQQNQQAEDIHSSHSQQNQSPEISPVTSSQVIQLTPEQQQQLEQLSEQLNIPVHQLLEEHKQATERQQRIQQIQRQLSSAEDEATPSPQVIQTEHQINFPQHLHFQDTEVHIAQQQSEPSQVLAQPVTLDDSRDLPQSLEMQLPSQLIAMHSSPISLNSLAISTNLQSALNWAQNQSSLPVSEQQRQEVLATTQAHLVSAPNLTSSQISLSPATDNSEVTVAQLLNSMANFQDGLTSGLLLQTNPQHQTTLPSDVAIMQAHHASITQPNVHPIFSPFANVATSLSNQNISSQHILHNINAMPTLETDNKTMHNFPHENNISIAISSNIKEPSNIFKPIKHQHSELKRRLSADSNLDGHKKHMPGSLTMMLSKGPLGCTEIESSFAKPKESDFDVPVRMRSKSGDEYKLMRSKSVDHTFMRPRSRTDDSIYRPKSRIDDVMGRIKSHPEEYLSRSDGAGIFRNPIPVTGSMKFKRKHRPAPLFIPMHLNSFQSRLRSPRLWEGGTDGKKFGTPPPYTPPPMLSPIRSGSGLFWTIQSAKPNTPMSAPATPKLLSQKRSSISASESLPPTIPEKDEEAPPESDIQPHVNVGTLYQAELPQLNSNRADAQKVEGNEDLVWEPRAMGDNTDDEVQYFQEFACSAAIHGNGSNVEYALHLLCMAKGNLQNALLMLMEDPPKLPVQHRLHKYIYQESDRWNPQEIESFHKALLKYSKDFFAIANEVGTKSVRRCVQFYYLWKKVCPDDYKRLRIIRRKREQEALYNLRSRAADEAAQASQQQQVHAQQLQQEQQQQQQQQQQQLAAQQQQLAGQPQPMEESDSEESMSTHSGEQNDNKSDISSSSLSPSPAPSFTCDQMNCHATFSSKQALNAHSRIHGPKHTFDVEKPIPRPRKPAANKASIRDENGDEIFPCRLCTRVFYKVKSRSAHMKSHKVAENENMKSIEQQVMKIKAEMVPDG